jgi:hypothetical protein
VGSRGLLGFLNPLISGMLNSSESDDYKPHFELDIAELTVMAEEKIGLL